MHYTNFLLTVLTFGLIGCQALHPLAGQKSFILKKKNIAAKTKYFHYKHAKTLKISCDAAAELKQSMQNISWYFCHVGEEQKCKEQQFMAQSSHSLELKICNTDLTDYTKFRCKACDFHTCLEHHMDILRYDVNMPAMQHELMVPLQDNAYMECFLPAYSDIEAEMAIIWLKYEGNVSLAQQRDIVAKNLIKQIENRKNIKDYDDLQKIFQTYGYEDLEQEFAARSYLPLLNVTSSDEGSYACLFLWQKTAALYNFELRTYGDNVTVQTPDMAPQIDSNVKSLVAARYEYFILKCIGTGQPKPSIRWFQYGQEVNCNMGRITCISWSLIVHHPIMIDTGLYSCNVCNKLGCATHDIKVEMRDSQQTAATLRPTIEPAERIAYPRENVKFHCKLNSVVQYMLWLKHSDSNSLKLISKLSIVDVVEDKLKQILQYHNITLLSRNKRHHHILNVDEDDVGWYTCMVFASFKKGMKSAFLSFTRSQHPQFVAKQNFTAKRLHQENDAVGLSCAARGMPTPRIAWFYNDKPHSCSNTNLTICKDFDLLIQQAVYENSGFYKCQVCNTLSCVERSFELTINPLLQPGKNRLKNLQIYPKDYKHVNYAANLTLICSNEKLLLADQSITTLWLLYKGTESPQTEMSKISFAKAYGHEQNFQRFLLANGLQLLLNYSGAISHLGLDNIQAEHQGWYMCIMFNRQTEGMQSLYLEVNDEHKPQFDAAVVVSSKMEKLYIDANAAVMLQCPVKANPLPSITWHHNNSELDCIEENVFCKDWSITLVNTTAGAEGLYFCNVCNRHGCIKREFELNFKLYSKEYSMWTMIILTAVSLLSVSFIILLVYVTFRCFAQRAFTEEAAHMLLVKQNSVMPVDVDWEIPRESLTLGTLLGQGFFGQVVLAKVEACSKLAAYKCVAIKMLKTNATDQDRENLIKEMNIMKQIGCHQNVLKFLGCCSQQGPLWLLMEYAANGNLKNFLATNAPSEKYVNFKKPIDFELTEEKLLQFSHQIAQGMAYLSSKQCIHRDLATRNILLDNDFNIKICDFGLSQYLQVEDYYYKLKTNGPLPFKWMAPESLEHQIFNTKSDIWSFGIVLWEIWSYGAQPYSESKSPQHHYQLLVKGEHMLQPKDCPASIYNIMQECWQLDAKHRPTFSQLVEKLQELLCIAVGYIQMFEPRQANMPTAGYLSMSKEDVGKYSK